MKVKLFVDKILGGKCFGANSVVDVFQPEAEAIIGAGEGCAVPDGTMARKKAYGAAGCMPPAGFGESTESEEMLRGLLGVVSADAKNEIIEQKTNTFKKK